MPSDDDRTLRRWDAQTVALEPTERATVKASAVGGERYGREEILGEGGMGVVQSCLDRQIGRRVAMKRIRGELAGSAAEERFLREARVQGQLEHPAIVPVYDLRVDGDGAWFTMKRVRGVTLAEVLSALREDAAPSARFSRRKLLTAFSSVCLAVHYAHDRGIIHRDLKPGNVMLGDFGEVYVLDWGLARVRGDAEVASVPSQLEVTAGDSDQRTRPGDMLGTPGYMAPEQIVGDSATLGPAADVYALGAILFEILTLVPLHEGAGVREILAGTLRGVEPRAFDRAARQEVPPELAQLVIKATLLDPEQRLVSARALHDAVERFLDGERDLELRRELADSHADRARQLAREAATESGPGHGSRRGAMREIGRALAFDPSNSTALELLVKLLTEPPRELPLEVKREIMATEREGLRRMGKLGAFLYSALLGFIPLLVWCGVRAWAWIGLLYAMVLGAAVVSYATWHARRPTKRAVTAVLVLSSLGMVATAALFGPLVLTPMALAVNATGFAVNAGGAIRLQAMVLSCVALLAAVVMSLVGIVPASYSFATDAMVLRPGAIELSGIAPICTLVACGLAGVVAGVLPVGRLYDGLRASQRQVFLYAWHLRELVPEAARGPTDPTAGP